MCSPGVVKTLRKSITKFVKTFMKTPVTGTTNTSKKYFLIGEMSRKQAQFLKEVGVMKTEEKDELFTSYSVNESIFGDGKIKCA